MIIQVTASRKVKPEDRSYLEAGLRHVVGNAPGPHTLRHGAARGGDRLFAAIAHSWGWTVLSRPADWEGPCRETCEPGHRRPMKYGSGTYCPDAGKNRNQGMVDEGADRGIAALKEGARNSGTRDCIDRMEAADIDVYEVVVP